IGTGTILPFKGIRQNASRLFEASQKSHGYIGLVIEMLPQEHGSSVVQLEQKYCLPLRHPEPPQSRPSYMMDSTFRRTASGSTSDSTTSPRFCFYSVAIFRANLVFIYPSDNSRLTALFFFTLPLHLSSRNVRWSKNEASLVNF